MKEDKTLIVGGYITCMFIMWLAGPAGVYYVFAGACLIACAYSLVKSIKSWIKD